LSTNSREITIRDHHQLVDAISQTLKHHVSMKNAIELKPSEPLDQDHIPIIGDACVKWYRPQKYCNNGAWRDTA